MLPAVVFAVAAGWDGWARFQSATYSREIYPEQSTPALGGANALEYEFTARHPRLEGLWVFFDAPDTSFAPRLVLTMRRAGEDRPFWTQSFECKKAEVSFGAFLCRIESLSFTKGGRYILTYAMPEVEAGRGWRLLHTASEDPESTLKWGAQEWHSAQPSLLWMENAPPHYPFIFVLACAALLAVCMLGAGRNTHFTGPAFIIAAAGSVVLGAYKWQQRIAQFNGNFWPDDYPALSHALYKFFTGHSSFGDCLAYFQGDRCGQAFFVPIVMAAFQAPGLSIQVSYLAANAVFLAASAALLLGLLRLYGIPGGRPAIATGLLFFSNPCFIGSIGALQTDLAGVAATLLFAYLLLRALAAGDARARAGWYLGCGVAAFLACTVRVALLPLPLVPACLFLWSVWCERERTWRERLEYLIPAVTGIALLAICWRSLHLWQTLEKNWAASKVDFGTKGTFFKWTDYARTTLKSMPIGLAVIILLWRRLFHDRQFAAVTGTAFSLIAMLGYTGTPGWMRYWSPPAALGIVFLMWALKEWPGKERALTALAGVIALVNAISILHR